MPYYRKKPVVIEAWRLESDVDIPTLEGVMTGLSGDWLIKGVKGEHYPCRDDIFRETFEPVNGEAAKHMVKHPDEIDYEFTDIIPFPGLDEANRLLTLEVYHNSQESISTADCDAVHPS